MDEHRYRDAERAFWSNCGASPEEFWLDLPRFASRVRVLEHGAGKPLLFIHGGPGAATAFAPLIAQLGDFRCLAMDRPGCAMSSPLSIPKEMAPNQFAAELVGAVVDQLGLSTVDLIGHSLGGTCALWYARRSPDRVSSIVFAGFPPFLEGQNMPALHRMMAIPGIGYLLTRLPMTEQGVRGFLRAMGESAEVRGDFVPSPFSVWWISLANDTPTMRNERELSRTGLTWRGARAEFVLSDRELREVATRALLIWGDGDIIGDATRADRMSQAMQGLDHALVPGTGHLPWLAQPNAVADAIRRFHL